MKVSKVNMVINAYILFIIFLWILPFAAIFSQSIFEFKWGGKEFLGIEAFLRLKTYHTFMRGLPTSLTLAALVTVTNIVVSLPAGYAISRFNFKGRTVLYTLLIVPYFIPDIVSGIYLLATYEFLYMGLTDTLLGITFGMASVSYPMALVPIVVAFNLLPREYEEAAACLGASWIKRFIYVTLPLIGPAIFAGMLLSFVWAFNNVVLLLFITGTNYIPASVALYADIKYRGMWPHCAAAASLMQLICFMIVLVYLKTLGARYLRGIAFI